MILDINAVADEFEMISNETHLFYSTDTGEFSFYMDGLRDDSDINFDDDAWIAAPSQRDLGEYDTMRDFDGTVKDSRKRDMLRVALEGKGAFRQFKDTLQRVGLADEWYAFKHAAFVEIAREWCEENDIEYTGYTPPEPPEVVRPERIAVTLATLESHNHFVGDIERGVKIYQSGGVEFGELEPNRFMARVPHKGGAKTVSLAFTADGTDLAHHVCECSWRYDDPAPVCRHVVAAVLAVQGGADCP